MVEVRSKFVRVRCRCGVKQIVFGNATLEVKCNSCGRTLATPTGGKANIQTKILNVIE